MKIELKEISIRELTQDYQDNDENGVFGFSGCLRRANRGAGRGRRCQTGIGAFCLGR